MLDFLRSILKWIILGIIILLLLIFIVKMANKNDNKKNINNNYDSGIHTIKSNTNELTEEIIKTEETPKEETETTIVVDAPDTASHPGIYMSLGMILLGTGITYIYKHSK